MATVVYSLMNAVRECSPGVTGVAVPIHLSAIRFGDTYSGKGVVTRAVIFRP